MASSLHTLTLMACILCLLNPVAAFGAGDIPSDKSLDGYVWRHGDIATAVLLNLPVSFKTSWRFTKLEKQQIYFGSWLRDYSQLIDVGALEKLPEEMLRVVISVLAFMEFGFATNEFDVTQQRLGVYAAVEHIDNPLGYPDNAKSSDNRLRGPVDRRELEIDPKTGMKNYIANQSGGWDTSAKYIRQMLRESIQSGRNGRGGNDKESQFEAFRTLGSALHTLEDFSAHSNFVELCLRKLGEEDVFACVGDACRVNTMSGKKVPPLVTGTFGSLDLIVSILGEADDKAASETKEEGELEGLLKSLNMGGKTFEAIYTIIKAAINTISTISFDNNSGIVGRMTQVADTAERVRKDPVAEKNNLKSDKHALWEAMEPAFMLHDEVSKWLDEKSEEIGEWFSFVTGPINTVKSYIKDFVYKFIALLLEPVIDQMREAVKQGREELEKNERENPGVSIFTAGSSFSDPSHSILAKDHYSNILNTPAGLVATVCTNWTTQQVVRCWDDSNIDAEETIDRILKILHHPDFVEGNQTKIQCFMFEAVQNWWNGLYGDEKYELRQCLTQDGVRRGNNNRKVTARMYANKPKGPAVFEGSQPHVIDRPKSAKANKLVELIESAAKALQKFADEVDAGTRKVVSFVNETATDFSHVANDTVNDVTKGIEDVVDKVGNGLNTVGGEISDRVNQAGEVIGKTAIDATESISHTAESFSNDVSGTTQSFVQGASKAAEDFGEDVRDTAQSFGNVVSGLFGL